MFVVLQLKDTIYKGAQSPSAYDRCKDKWALILPHSMPFKYAPSNKYIHYFKALQ